MRIRLGPFGFQQAFALLLVAVFLSLTAHAATITLNNGASCEYATITTLPNGSVSAVCVAVVTPVPPVTPPVVAPPSGACPAVSGGVIDSTLIYSGLNILRMGSGAVAALPLLPVRDGRKSAQAQLGETTTSPDPVTIEMSISRCKGQIESTAGSPLAPGCMVKSQQRNFNTIVWIGKPYPGVDQATADRRGWCIAYESDGVPRYVNVRYTYSNCQYQPCGFAIQGQDGPL